MLAIPVALGAALLLPLDVVVFALLVVGVPHLILEIRYVFGHYRHLLRGRFLVGLNIVLALIIAGRLLWPGPAASRVEILLVAGVLIAAIIRSTAAPAIRGAALVATVIGAGFSITHTESYFVIQAHLHNIVPVVFLWAWSGHVLVARDRRRFRAVTVVWIAVIPAALLIGLLDPWLAGGASSTAQSLAAQGRVLSTITPTGAPSILATRLLTIFAFAQLLHYVVWCWFFPRWGGPPATELSASAAGPWLAGPRLALIVGAATAFVALLAWIDYRSGRSFYSAFAAYHAYLEFPVLIALLLGWTIRHDPKDAR